MPEPVKPPVEPLSGQSAEQLAPDPRLSLTNEEMEILFCCAILTEGTTVAARILGKYNEYKQDSDRVLSYWRHTIEGK